MNAAASFCFHCGDVVADTRWQAAVAGSVRAFCCAGCAAVAEAIDAGGLARYYDVRTQPAPRPAVPTVPAELFDRRECAVALRGDDTQVSARLALDGLRCPACLWLIGERLRALPGVTAVHTDYASQTARVVWPTGAPALGAAVAAVEALGYRARPVAGSALARAEATGRLRDGERLVAALVLGMAVMNAALALYLADAPTAPLPLWETVVRWLSAALCVPLLAWCGADFFAGAWRDLRHARLGMDLPIVLGLTAAFAGSLHGLLDGGPVYFDAIGMFVPVVLGARWMEARARRRAARALDRLSLIEPQMVQRVEATGAVRVVAAFDLAPGDRIRVAHADTVPADGCVASGTALLDESLLTGEPYPARRDAGDRVSAGSVNLGAEFDLTVERVGTASLLGQLRELLERGLASRPAAAEAADRLAPALVALVLLAAVATALGWLAVDPPRALPAVIAVLVVTCPCALALATPLTLALAAGRFADAGVIPLRLAALDALATARVMLLDKTGTLTEGRPTVTAVMPFGGVDEAQARATAGALAEQSPHPVALALRAEAPAAARATAVQSQPGAGVSGCVDGASWCLGTLEFAGAVPTAAQAQARVWLQQGRMVAALGDGAGRGAVFALHDAPRPGLAGLAAQLDVFGVERTVCVSGDPSAAVGEIARAAGLAEHHAGCSPLRKLDELTRLRTELGPVVMVGDGINDAPTLAHADASLSFADAPQLARGAADFLLQGHSLVQLVTARRIARRARRILRQNIGWAVGYNLLAIPLAAAGWIAPWSAALGMGASAALVIANALRIRLD